MTNEELWLATAGALLLTGGWRVVTAPGLVVRLVGLNVMAAAATLALVTVGETAGGVEARAGRTMAVSGIVVMAGVTAFAAGQAQRLQGGPGPGRDGEPVPDGDAAASGDGGATPDRDDAARGDTTRDRDTAASGDGGATPGGHAAGPGGARRERS